MRRGLVLICAAGVLGGCGGTHYAGQRIEHSSQLVNFALHDQDGRVVSLDSFRGRYLIVSFLYTHCPDVCPLIAANVGTALRTLGPSKPVSALAVSVDPAGDTPAAVRTFLREHRDPAAFRYLTGTLDELRPVWQEFNVLVEARSAVRLLHDAPVFVVDPSGRPVLMYDSKVSSKQLLGDLRRLLR